MSTIGRPKGPVSVRRTFQLPKELDDKFVLIYGNSQGSFDCGVLSATLTQIIGEHLAKFKEK